MRQLGSPAGSQDKALCHLVRFRIVEEGTEENHQDRWLTMNKVNPDTLSKQRGQVPVMSGVK